MLAVATTSVFVQFLGLYVNFAFASVKSTILPVVCSPTTSAVLLFLATAIILTLYFFPCSSPLYVYFSSYFDSINLNYSSSSLFT